MANFQKVQDDKIPILTRPLKSYQNYIRVSENHRALVVNRLRPQCQENMLIPVQVHSVNDWSSRHARSTFLSFAECVPSSLNWVFRNRW